MLKMPSMSIKPKYVNLQISTSDGLKASSHLTLLSFVNTIPMKAANGHFAEAALERMVQTAS